MNIVLALVCTLFVASGSLAAGIDWEIANRFRAFDYLDASDRASPQLAVATFERLSPVARFGNYDADVDSDAWLDRVARSGGSPYAHSPKPWNEQAGAAQSPYPVDFATLPSAVVVLARLSAAVRASVALGSTCAWSVDGVIVTTQPCGSVVAVSVPNIGGVVSVQADGQPVANDSVSPRLRIVVGLGDSYAAGEGSPDSPTTWRSGLDATQWPLGAADELDSFVAQPAKWQSVRCNRSFYSYQNLAALRLAASDPHAIIAFVHLACAGAEIIDGILAQQRRPPGHSRNESVCPPFEANAPLSRECDMPYSQLRALANVLCDAGSQKQVEQSVLENQIRAPLRGLTHAKTQPDWIDDLRVCPSNQRKKVDTLFLSIGGNDMGFGGVIAWGLMPYKSKSWLLPARLFSDAIISTAGKRANVVCPFEGRDMRCEGPTALDRIGDLPERFTVLKFAVEIVTGTSPEKTIVSTYPNPLHDLNGKLCGNKPYSNDPTNSWGGVRMLIPIAAQPSRWQINLTEWEAEQIQRDVIPALNGAIIKATKPKAGEHQSRAWGLADLSTTMDRQGWCTGSQNALLPLAKAHTWNALANQTRRIRTGNDSLLTQWSGNERRADGLAGTFHPNVQGYAAMSDVLFRAARIKPNE